MGDDLDLLVQTVNQKLSVVQDWCNSNMVSINPSKSEYMLVTGRFVEQQPQIRIGDNIVKCSNSFKYLGVHIDVKQKFQNQIDNVKGKLSRLCRAAFRLSGYFNLSAAKNMYYGCIYSTLSYCLVAWGGVLLCTHRADSVVNLQAKIVKILFRKFYPTHRCLFHAAKILKLPDLYRLRVSVFMYKIVVLGELPVLHGNLDLAYATHDYSTRSANLLVPPFPRVEAFRMSYLHQFIRVWNDIPVPIKQLSTLKLFKTALTNFLISNYL